MANVPSEYIAEVEIALLSSSVIRDYHFVRKWANTDDGYIRFRATLIDDSFLEAAEYFILAHYEHYEIETVDYRYQWMSATKNQLICRWDNAPDHPELDNFPHHIHRGDEKTIVPGMLMSLLDLLSYLEAALNEK
jgi:hypothetical protein